MSDEIEFKQFKGHLRVDHGGQRVKLTYPQWDTFARAVPAHDHWRWRDRHDPPDGYMLDGDWYVERKLVYTPLIETRATRLGEQHMLSPLGERVLALLPPCPPRAEWPATKAAQKGLTAYQRGLLAAWPKRLVKAIPLGAGVSEESRWVRARNGADARSFASMHRLGMIEPGARGIVIEDGCLVFDDPSDPDVELVFRLTVLGALSAET